MYMDEELYLLSKMNREQFVNWAILAAQNRVKETTIKRMGTPIKSYFDPATNIFHGNFSDGDVSWAAIDVVKNEMEIAKEIRQAFRSED